MRISPWGTILPGMACALLLQACTPSPAEQPSGKDQRPSPPVHALAAAEPADDAPPANAALPEVTPAEVALDEPLPALKDKPVADPPPIKEAMPEDLPPGDGASDPTPFPSTVTAFMIDRDGCDHFRGEEAYDADRAAFLQENLRQLCTGTDARLAALRGRYASNPDVVAALAHYEDRIEGEGVP